MAGGLPVTGVAHTGIRVKDLERSREFYGLLGFEFIIGPVGPEPVAIVRHPSGVEINFILNARDASPVNILMDVEEKHAGYTHIALAVSDLEATQAVLKDAGIEITEGPINFPGGHAAVFIRDPDGTVIELNHAPAED